MKSAKKFLFLLLLMGSASSLLAQQKSAFNAKKHKDTTLDKSSLRAETRNGRQTMRESQERKYKPVQQVPGSKLAVKKSVRSANPHEAHFSSETGLPIFVKTKRTIDSKGLRVGQRNDAKQECFAYLKELGSITRIATPEESFIIKKIERGTNGKTHIRLGQKYQGISVYGSEAIVHLDAAGNGEMFNGKFHVISSTKVSELHPTLTIQAAVDRVVADLSAKTIYRTLSPMEKKWLDYEAPSIDTVLYEDKGIVSTYLLAYHISIHPNFTEHWEYVIDAKSGRILEGYKNTCHADGPRTASATDLNGNTQTINTIQKGSQYLLQDISRTMYNSTDSSGRIITLDANFTYGDNFNVQSIVSSDNTWNSIAVSAHYNAGIAYEYYRTQHNRNSIDGNGGTIYSFINVADPETGDHAFDNAFWNNKFMYYGNGGSYFKPLAGGVDVGGHEMTHGVVQNSANLKYLGESGAINESMADIFGTMMDSTDWLIGEDVILLSAFPSGALRSLADPHNGGTSLSNLGYQPRVVSEKYTGSSDNGGVHINSGIPNWAFYKFATAIGSRYKASMVYYHALTTYLTANSQFIDLRLAVIQSANDVYSADPSIATAAGAAFDAVEIMDGTGTTTSSTTETMPLNPGTEYLLSTNTDTSYPSIGLMRSDDQGTNSSFSTLTTMSVANKPSVTDDGKTCVYVGTDSKIHKINVSPGASVNNTVLNNTAIWSSVAISKDGKRIAATTTDQDTSIYVIDLVSGQTVRFILYNPTYTQGVKSDGPVYADGIEWDYTGEYLVYDCFNEVTATGQANLEYWDINLLHVWDNSISDFSDGEVSKLFNNLEPGEGVGNPAFAKNSPNIIAFDYEDDNTGQFGVFGLNLQSNDLNVIAVNNYLGWPSYDRTDSRVAYTGDDGTGTGTLNVYYTTLNADRISSSDTENGLIPDAMWPVYYTVGTRDITTEILQENNTENTALTLYPNPTRNELSVEIPKGAGNFLIEILNQLGQTVYSKNYSSADETVSLNVTDLPSGVYSLHFKGEESSVSKKFVKQDR